MNFSRAVMKKFIKLMFLANLVVCTALPVFSFGAASTITNKVSGCGSYCKWGSIGTTVYAVWQAVGCVGNFAGYNHVCKWESLPSNATASYEWKPIQSARKVIISGLGDFTGQICTQDGTYHNTNTTLTVSGNTFQPTCL